MMCPAAKRNIVIVSDSLEIQLFRERLSEKSTKVHATRLKGGLGIH